MAQPSVSDLCKEFYSRKMNLMGDSFHSVTIEIVNTNTPDCHNLNDSAIKPTNHSLVSIAQILLEKIEGFIDLVRANIDQNADIEHLNDLILHLTVALHDLDVTTIGEEYKGSLAYALAVVANDLNTLLQSIPTLLGTIAKESTNV